ncbi:ATP-dependent endonuclease [Inquilinus sp. YAF38]|uniref:ATP-dependent nuclease n=1 Tax=Inquilinus sp. YAF38 TaxID=3233084 RepID=UPI003F91628F
MGIFAMKKLPNIIRSIDIKYYRSINTCKLRNCSEFNIITGKNDVGKSNLLRALNLFFNESAPSGEPITFEEEFSHIRLDQVRKNSVKGKQFIQISIEFNRGKFFLATLPEKFRVTKTWYRDSLYPFITHDLAARIKSGQVDTTIPKAQSSLSRFLGRIEFNYIPAIKDNQTFSEIISELQSAIFENSERGPGGFRSRIEQFNMDLQNQASELKSEFSTATGINAKIALPSEHRDLFQAFRIRTEGTTTEDVGLDQRGDGIRVRFIPAMLNYIAERSSKFHIWGFEEPENSMEFARAFELCSTMRNNYSVTSQIFVTTHSPAFIDLRANRQSIFLAKWQVGGTVYEHISEATAKSLFSEDLELHIARELGHIALLGQMHDRIAPQIERIEDIISLNKRLSEDLSDVRRPVLLTEGRTDAIIIQAAWRHLRDGDLPAAIKSCNLNPADQLSEAAGFGTLAIALRGIRPDHPHFIIGLFDRDEGGKSGFQLDNNFSALSDFDDVKISRNGMACGLLLPYPDSKKCYADFENLSIEFLFDDDHLLKRTDGFGIEIQFENIEVKRGRRILEKRPATEPWFRKIVSGKSHFADHVVPTLPKEAFLGFEPLIRVIERLVEMHSARPADPQPDSPAETAEATVQEADPHEEGGFPDDFGDLLLPDDDAGEPVPAESPLAGVREPSVFD